MNKLISTICFCLVFLFISSCEIQDLTEDVEWVYDYASSCNTIDGNMWSPRSPGVMYWDYAVSYCDNLTACGYSDWRLPTISELRTLIKNCSLTETGGSCGVTDSCLSHDGCWNDACHGCEYDDSGKYSKLGDTLGFWASSCDYGASWIVHFDDGTVNCYDQYSYVFVRCVR